MIRRWAVSRQSGHAICKRLNTEVLPQSTAKANAMAQARTQLKAQSGTGAISKPNPASVAAMSRSAIDEKTTQRLGRGDAQIRRRARMA